MAIVKRNIAQGPSLVLNITGLNANSSIVIPKKYCINQIIFRNTTANAITGGLRIGKTSGAADVVVAQAIGANAIGTVVAASVLLRYFSNTVDQTVFPEAVTAWNNASISLTFVLDFVPG